MKVRIEVKLLILILNKGGGVGVGGELGLFCLRHFFIGCTTF